MRKIIITCVILALSIVCFAQVRDVDDTYVTVRKAERQKTVRTAKSNRFNSIGVMCGIGWDHTYGINAISVPPPIGLNYQKRNGDQRFELNIGGVGYLEYVFDGPYELHHNAMFVGITGTYQKIWYLGQYFGCYAGGGISLGYGGNDAYKMYRSSYQKIWNKYSQGLDFGIVAVAGIELHSKNTPWVFSFDTRPRVHFIGFEDCNFRMTYNLGIHYTF